MTATTLEVPVDSLDAARLAAPHADRLELCHDLASEGWTPKWDFVRACRDLVEGTRCTLVAMIRPEYPGCRRELDVAAFQTTRELLYLCLREIGAAAAAGAHSVAVSLLTADGHVDRESNSRLLEHATNLGLETAFLRTFDLLKDRERGMRDLSELGFVRVVTAGVLGWDASVASLGERIATVEQDVRNAEREAARLGQKPVEVVPGGGVRASNASRWLEVSRHLHASCRRDGVFSEQEIIALRLI